ncbi:MAG TPA: ATP-binding protein [Bryobacteraceae bacterium]|jgi:signal transduction histidine kinase|nr:ATP-binding protein [Bryobacteraceae bacterium]
MENPTTDLTQQLTAVPVFSDLASEELSWLASHMEVVHYAAGDLVIEEDSPADRMIVILEGEIASRRERGGVGDGRTYSARAGQVTGMLPYSRLTRIPLTVRAMTPTTLAFLHVSHFQEMLHRFPELGQKLVGVLADRIRETTRSGQQREKLTALGKLSAGLAHELNNPASAVRNAAVNLQQTVGALRTASLHLDKRGLSAEQRVFLARLECDWSSEHPPAALDSLERSDREEEIGGWLEERRIENARLLAPGLVDAGCDLKTLRGLAERFDGDTLAEVVTRLTASFTINRLVEQIASGTSRIGDLVRAIKQYSYMDQASEQEIDIHEGLENTLIMFHHRLKYGISVVRQYDRSIPQICARGGELNQVWTNLIDNAVDAMDGHGELVVRTAAEFGRVLVEIRDSGPGIPPEIQDRIFEPFFTTKPVGEGTGLGLDTVYRIVQQHRGEIRVDSQPGRTAFQVRLPFADDRERHHQQKN